MCISIHRLDSHESNAKSVHRFISIKNKRRQRWHIFELMIIISIVVSLSLPTIDVRIMKYDGDSKYWCVKKEKRKWTKKKKKMNPIVVVIVSYDIIKSNCRKSHWCLADVYHIEFESESKQKWANVIKNEFYSLVALVN